MIYSRPASGMVFYNGEVALYLLSVMQPEDIVLIKGSNGMHLDEVVNNMLG